MCSLLVPVSPAVFDRYGYASRERLLDARIDRRRIGRAVAGGQLLRVGRGLYRAPGADPGWRGELAGACLLAGPHAFAFRRSAGALWGLDGMAADGRGPGGDYEIAIARSRYAARSSGVHRLSTLRDGDVVRVEGIRATSPLRTLQDLAAVADPDLFERAVESALRTCVSEADLRARTPLIPRAGARTWNIVLGRRPPGAAPTESDAETRFAQMCRAHQIPQPVRQHPVVLGRRLRLDFAWPDVRVGAEVDGRSVHGPDALAEDLRRQNRIVLDGWVLLRFTFEDIVRYPEQTALAVRQALDLAALRFLAGPAHL